MRGKKEKKTLSLLPEGHKKPVSRRDFLAHGLIGASSYMVLPSIADLLLGQRAFASTACPELKGSSMIPLFLIDAAGGASLSGNWLPRGLTGAPLPKYRRVGVPEQNPITTSAMGHPLITTRTMGEASFYNILNNDAILSAAARSKLQIGIQCTASFNDTDDNPLNFTAIAALAGLIGTKFEAALTTYGSPTGIYAKDVISVRRLKPVFINDINGPRNITSMGAALNGLNFAHRRTIMKYLGRLGASQLDKLRGMNHGEELKAIMECAVGRNMGNVDPTSDVDPQNFPEMVETWMTNNPNAVSTLDIKFRGQLAAVTHNVLKNFGGAATIPIGGCDYHNSVEPGTDNHGDNKEKQIAEVMARIVQSAHRYQVPCVIAIVSDGSVGVADEDLGSRKWAADDQGNSLAVMALYDPKASGNAQGANGMLRTQVGHYVYDENGGKEKIGVGPSTVSGRISGGYGLFLNYLALNHANPTEKFYSIVDPRVFPAANVDASLLWVPKNRKRTG